MVVGAGDGPAANLGCGALAPGVAGLSIGTSGALRMVARRAPPRRCRDALLLPAHRHGVGGRRAVSNGGIVVRWAGRSLAPDLAGAAGAGEGDEALLALAATAPAGLRRAGDGALPASPSGRRCGTPTCPRRLPRAAPPPTPAPTWSARLSRACASTVALVLDQLDRLAPGAVGARHRRGVPVRRCGARSPEGSLDRPLQVLDGVEGTALGAAALGLFALGRERTLEAALASLCDLEAHLGPPETPPPELVATYHNLRRSVPGLIAGLGRLGSFYGEPS